MQDDQSAADRLSRYIKTCATEIVSGHPVIPGNHGSECAHTDRWTPREEPWEAIIIDAVCAATGIATSRTTHGAHDESRTYKGGDVSIVSAIAAHESIRSHVRMRAALIAKGKGKRYSTIIRNKLALEIASALTKDRGTK